jgi:hypothetical protein
MLRHTGVMFVVALASVALVGCSDVAPGDRLTAPPAASAIVAQSTNGAGNSDAAHACQQGGYLGQVGSNGETFKNTGECVSFAAHGGQLLTGIPVPAGHTVTFDAASFHACNQLIYGHQLNAGLNVALDSKASGCTDLSAAGGTIGPFSTAKVLRVFLSDVTCGDLYYSDGNHARVTGSNPFQVDISDSGGFCESDPTMPRPPGTVGNISVRVVIS